MSSRLFLNGLFVLLSGLFFANQSDAMPQFTRKYNLSCDDCHASHTRPRLNDEGYKFRRAGYRMPDQIGKEEAKEFLLGDYTAARIQLRYTASQSEDKSVSPSKKSSGDTMEMRELTLYPMTGSFEKHWGSGVELTFPPEEGPEIENAYLRGVWGDESAWVEARAGLFHPFEGFGASDRPISISRPLFQTGTANKNQNTLYKLWGQDQVGAELGLQWQNTSLTVSILNGLNVSASDGKVVAHGITADEDNRKDLLVFANQILGETTGISLYYSRGYVSLPVDVAGFAADTDARTWKNTYQRAAAYGSWGLGNALGLAGYMMGDDKSRQTSGDLEDFKSKGYFAELDYDFKVLSSFLRWDNFDPSTTTDDDQIVGLTVGVNFAPNEWIHVIPEFQYRKTGSDLTQTTALLHGVVIY
ncbi:MAG: hypothetical protein HYW48_05000 [Deltaproteobacteria bacterium]|nr:hypothetical protein [Deltaproteobacteria bacterium]